MQECIASMEREICGICRQPAPSHLLGVDAAEAPNAIDRKTACQSKRHDGLGHSRNRPLPPMRVSTCRHIHRLLNSKHPSPKLEGPLDVRKYASPISLRDFGTHVRGSPRLKVLSPNCNSWF